MFPFHPKVTLDTFLRYIVPALLLWSYVFYVNLDYFKTLSLDAGRATALIVPIILVTVIIGPLFYSVYRVLIYDQLISLLLDRINRRRGKHNYRIWLQNRFEITDSEAEELYSAIRLRIPALNTPSILHLSIREWSSRIHMLYQASIVSIVVFIYCIVFYGFNFTALMLWYTRCLIFDCSVVD